MKHLFPITFLFLLSAFATAAVAAGEAKTEAKAKGHWVCPSCGSPCDKEVFDHPGVCPTCGMKLVEQGTEAAPHHNEPLKKVAILIFNHVEIVDFAGPYEVFGAANFDVYTVGETKDPVVTAMGLTVVPRYRFADAPQPDILVVPGGGVQDAEKNGALLAWIKDKAAHGEHTMSVCNGAFILASAGLLDGLTATTTAHNIEGLHRKYPKVTTVSDQRFVEHGKIMTTAGLSAGIDGALQLVKEIRGEAYAHLVALTLEYDWRPQTPFARAALADNLLPDLNVRDDGKWELRKFQGDRDRWELVIRSIDPKSNNDALMEHFNRALAEGKWTKVNSSANRTDWKFSGRDGKPWTGVLTIDPAGSTNYDVKLTIARAG